MQNKLIAFATVFAAALPSVASAECIPAFADGPSVVTISPNASFGNQQLVERFFIRIRNDGDTACELRLAVGRDFVRSDPQFPDYSLSGPTGNIPIVEASSAINNVGSTNLVNIPAAGETAVPFNFRAGVGWGDEAGVYNQELVFSFVSNEDRTISASQRTELSLTIPAAARIRFAGAGARGDGPAQVDMGTLAPDMFTRSPPFAIRVLSTSGYQMLLDSENRGALRRVGGVERIPYRMTVGGRLMNFAGGSDGLNMGSHTSSRGDVHPVVIVVGPDPTRHAGDYNDRITVTVTPI